MTHGILLTNLGTPHSFKIKDVSVFLGKFLTDARVINLPFLLRYLLVFGLIVPFRAKKSAQAYKLIWTKQGSPLLCHSQNLAIALQKKLGSKYTVALGMRYGNPSIAQALKNLQQCTAITVLPLYPQYSSAATGSSLQEIMRLIGTQEVIPSLAIIRDFYQHPAYLAAQAQIIKSFLNKEEHILFSYHGIPENQIKKAGCTKVCSGTCPSISLTNQSCYKAQCYHTTNLLAAALQLKATQYSTAFQSRLGRTPWIKPYTDELLVNLAHQNIKNLTIVCPSFVADCLETLEEIGIRAKELWFKLGGQKFTIIPCLNTHEEWIKALIEITQL